MSIDATIERVGQIVSLQQQIADPAAAGGLPAAASAAASLSAGAEDFASALASAQGTPGPSQATAGGSVLGAAGGSVLGAAGGSASVAGPTSGSGAVAASILGGTGLTGLGGPGSITGLGATTALGAADPRVAAMLETANSLVGKPYMVGGGHSGWGPQAGYDCSGFVSAVLHAGGYLSSPQTTVTLPQQPGILAGPGQYVTIYDRALPGQSGHVIIEIDGQFYESGGMSGSWGGGGGVERIATPSAAYLATFPTVLHPAGL